MKCPHCQKLVPDNKEVLIKTTSLLGLFKALTQDHIDQLLREEKQDVDNKPNNG